MKKSNFLMILLFIILTSLLKMLWIFFAENNIWISFAGFRWNVVKASKIRVYTLHITSDNYNRLWRHFIWSQWNLFECCFQWEKSTTFLTKKLCSEENEKFNVHTRYMSGSISSLKHVLDTNSQVNFSMT